MEPENVLHISRKVCWMETIFIGFDKSLGLVLLPVK